MSFFFPVYFNCRLFLYFYHLVNDVLQCEFWCRPISIFLLLTPLLLADLYCVQLEKELQMTKWNRQPGTCLQGIFKHSSLIFAIHEHFSPATLCCPSVSRKEMWHQFNMNIKNGIINLPYQKTQLY